MVVFSEPSLEKFIMPCKRALNTFKCPTIPLDSPHASRLVFNACNEFGFFKVVNHGIPLKIMNKLEEESVNFFNLSPIIKERVSPPNPFGYGNKFIGRNGDIGWLEYLLLRASPTYISDVCTQVFPENPDAFRNPMLDYIEQVKNMTEQVLVLIAEGLGIEDKEVFSSMLRDETSDTYMRINHYPPCPEMEKRIALMKKDKDNDNEGLVGFGEHTDPQIISVLRSNDTDGFQICLKDDTWVTVPPDNASFFFNVGDSMQVLTNGRFKSVKHRVFSDYTKSRLSMIFFVGPPPLQNLGPLRCIMEKGEECLYRDFTWWEYKTSVYKTKLSCNRLERFGRINYTPTNEE